MPPEPRVCAADLQRARQALSRHGEIPDGLALPESLRRSWRRSLAAGLAPMAANLPDEPLPAPEMARAAERQGSLLAAARPVMRYLHGQVAGSGCMVLLADDRGLLIEALGDAGFADRAARVALRPGANWAEAARGTNGIGTALAEAAPVVVQGAEHFVARNGFLACAGVPLFGPDGQVLGVLDISCDHRAFHPHTFGLARTAAQMIEDRLFQQRHGRTPHLRLHAEAAGLGLPGEGLVALAEDGRILGANSAARRLLRLGEGGVRLRLAELREQARRRAEQPLLLRLPDGRPLHARLEGEAAAPRALPRPAPRPTDALAALDTGDPRLARAVAQARRVLGHAVPLLLTGETGTGKDRFARALHASGPRKAAPFIAINCAALPETLIEGELFGHTRGAFTGARPEGAAGLIRAADGGTLFLDEIGEMPLPAQARLLRVLEERAVRPLGGGRAVPVDFCLVSATNKDLRAEVAAGRFRADLYWRLNGLTLGLPPLREREDFPALLASLLAEAAGPGGAPAIAPALAQRLARLPWPGNLRQLASVLRTACLMMEPGEAMLDEHHLPPELEAPLPRALPPGGLRAAEDEAILRAVEEAGRNMSLAARRLGISRNTLYRRLRQAGG